MARVLHIVTRVPDALTRAAMRGDRSAGDEVDCLCLHDAVYWASARARDDLVDEPLELSARLLAGADDCRRRGLAPGAVATLEYPDIIDLVAAADRVIAW